MGKIIQKVRLTNSGQKSSAEEGLLDPSLVNSVELEMLVDTGAAMVCLPLSVIQKLQLRKIQTRQALTANGVVERGIYSPVTIEILDRQADLNVMELPDDGTPALLGYLPLEALDLYPNPKLQILEGNPKYDGKMVVDLL